MSVDVEVFDFKCPLNTFSKCLTRQKELSFFNSSFLHVLDGVEVILLKRFVWVFFFRPSSYVFVFNSKDIVM